MRSIIGRPGTANPGIVLGMAMALLMSAETALADRSTYAGHTIIYHENSHGTQVEYTDPSGKAYLWYPTNERSLPGVWQIRFGMQICFDYGPNTYNPVTRSRARWSCTMLRQHKGHMKHRCKGDVFGLASGKIPFVLPRHVSLVSQLSKRCSGKP